MSWISEAHAQWHSVHGAMEVCPLDCGVGEDYDYDPEWEDEELPLDSETEEVLLALYG